MELKAVVKTKKGNVIEEKNLACTSFLNTSTVLSVSYRDVDTITILPMTIPNNTKYRLTKAKMTKIHGLIRKSVYYGLCGCKARYDTRSGFYKITYRPKGFTDGNHRLNCCTVVSLYRTMYENPCIGESILAWMKKLPNEAPELILTLAHLRTPYNRRTSVHSNGHALFISQICKGLGTKDFIEEIYNNKSPILYRPSDLIDRFSAKNPTFLTEWSLIKLINYLKGEDE
jgi:hypothetical protein